MQTKPGRSATQHLPEERDICRLSLEGLEDLGGQGDLQDRLGLEEDEEDRLQSRSLGTMPRRALQYEGPSYCQGIKN